jgi:ribosomal protein L12E/L44/L45/RPP1/RPP2
MQGTYEEALITTANQKSGLNEAILGNINIDNGNPEDNAKRIARLLQEGAHSITTDEATANANASIFEGQDIDSILKQRTSKRCISNKTGSSFSVASFRAGGGAPTDGDAANFWQDLLPEAVKAHQKAAREKNLVRGPRVRRKVNYREPRGARVTVRSLSLNVSTGALWQWRCSV